MAQLPRRGPVPKLLWADLCPVCDMPTPGDGDDVLCMVCIESLVDSVAETAAKAVMMLPSSDSSTNDELKLSVLDDCCPVCGDRVSGYHYGLQTCESCKGTVPPVTHSCSTPHSQPLLYAVTSRLSGTVAFFKLRCFLAVRCSRKYSCSHPESSRTRCFTAVGALIKFTVLVFWGK